MKLVRLLLLLATAALVAGCGSATRIAYNNGDLAVRYMADEYFDLRAEQAELARAQIARFHAWHRREELPQYAAFFQGMAERVGRGLQREDVLWAIDGVKARLRAVAEHGVAEATPVLARLDDANLAALERKLAANNEKFAREFLSGDAKSQARARARATQKRFEDWIGTLTPTQEALIAEFSAAGLQGDRVRFEDRQRRQGELLAILRAERSSPDLERRVRGYFVAWEEARSAEYARQAKAWEARLVALILELDRSLAPAQRERAVRRLEAYANDFLVLARDGQPADAARVSLPQPQPGG